MIKTTTWQELIWTCLDCLWNSTRFYSKNIYTSLYTEHKYSWVMMTLWLQITACVANVLPFWVWLPWPWVCDTFCQERVCTSLLWWGSLCNPQCVWWIHPLMVPYLTRSWINLRKLESIQRRLCVCVSFHRRPSVRVSVCFEYVYWFPAVCASVNKATTGEWFVHCARVSVCVPAVWDCLFAVCVCVLLITVFKVVWSQALASKPNQTTDWQTHTLPHSRTHMHKQHARMFRQTGIL